MEKSSIFYVEDDATLAFLTHDYLEQFYKVSHFENGEKAIQNFSNTFDLCILDISLPKKDGFEIAQYIRSISHEVPIIFLSARSLKEDRIKGFHLGADDFLIKPFSLEELKLKIDVFLKRSQIHKSEPLKTYTLGGITFYSDEYFLEKNEQKITLTERESSLLKLFVEHKNTILKREKILHELWGTDDYFSGRSLDVFISRLRKLFADEPSIKIENLPRIGFKLVVS